MKFGDVILAVATMAVIFVLVYCVLGMALIPSMDSYSGQSIAGIVSMLVAGLVAGFAFAGDIQEESKMKALGKIVILFATVGLFLTMIAFSGNIYYWAYIEETLQDMFSTAAWTTIDWFVYEQLATFLNVALNVVLSLVLGFIGLYIGSMLRKPRKS